MPKVKSKTNRPADHEVASVHTDFRSTSGDATQTKYEEPKDSSKEMESTANRVATEEGSFNPEVATRGIERKAEIMESMPELGSHVSTSEENGVTSLHIASTTRDYCVEKSILEEEEAGPNTMDAEENIPLHDVMSDNEQKNELVKLLLVYRAIPELENEDDNSNLNIVINMDNPHAVEKFSEQNYENGMNFGDETVSSVVDLLIEYGAKVKMFHANYIICPSWDIIGMGADFKNVNDDGNNALHTVLKFVKYEEGMERIVVMLIEKGADLNTVYYNGNTALHCTFKFVKEPEVIERIAVMLIEKGAYFNTANGDGDTALHCTFKFVKEPEVKERIAVMLIEKGADFNAVNGDGDTALHCTFKFVKEPKVIEQIAVMLIEKGADFNTANGDGDTALHCTFKFVKEPEVKERIAVMLIERGADFNTVNGDGDTALHCTFNRVRDKEALQRIAVMLIEKGADFNTANGDGDTALHCMFKFVKEPEVIERIAVMLIEKGADFNAVNGDGDTALHCTFKLVKEPEVIERIAVMLIEKGADFNTANGDGDTALHCTFKFVKEPEVKERIAVMLIEKGADVNIGDSERISPLMTASIFGYLGIAKILLSHDADLNAIDDKGNTPLHYAIQNKHTSIVDLLSTFGADATKRDVCCATAETLLIGIKRRPLEPPSATFGSLLFFFTDNQRTDLTQSLLISRVLKYTLVDDIQRLTPELINETRDGSNFLLTWLVFHNSIGEMFIEKLKILLDRTLNLRMTAGYHQRNFLHLLTTQARILYGEDHSYSILILIDMIEQYADAAVVNSVDVSGWTPVHIVFIICDILNAKSYDAYIREYNKHCRQLIGLSLRKGFKVINTYNDGASVVHYAAGTRMIDALKLLLKECEAGVVYEEDINGSTPLHYAAFANSVDGVKLLLDKYSEKNQKDCEGRTAGELAKMLGYGDIVQLLCDKDGLWKSDIYNCKEYGKIESSDSMSYNEFTDELIKQDATKTNIDDIYTSLLKSPVFGSTEYQDRCFKEESELVKGEVMAFVKKFSEQFGRQYPQIAFDPKLRGSMCEGTKRGLPDEFDVMLIMHQFSENCQVNVINYCKANVGLMGFPSDRDASISPVEVNVLLHILIKKILRTHSIWEGSRLKYVSCERMNVGLCLNLVFNGHLYKLLLHISIDLVPCVVLKMPVPVNVSIDWPVPLDFSKCQLYGLFRDKYDGLDLSSTDYEEVLLKSLPSAAIDAYVLGKAFGSAHFKWSGKRLAKIFRKSYAMKKAILISFQEHKNPLEVSRHEWIAGIISVASNMEEYVKKNDCRRCIFHAEKWSREENDCLKLSF